MKPARAYAEMQAKVPNEWQRIIEELENARGEYLPTEPQSSDSSEPSDGDVGPSHGERRLYEHLVRKRKTLRSNAQSQVYTASDVKQEVVRQGMVAMDLGLVESLKEELTFTPENIRRRPQEPGFILGVDDGYDTQGRPYCTTVLMSRAGLVDTYNMIKCGKNLPLAIDGHFKSCRGSWTLLVIAACVQGVLESGKWGWSTVPLMAALCLNETKRAVEYLLRKLRMVMEGLSDGSFVEPYCILSDASRPITSAVKAVFSKTASQRCAWHTVEACKKAGVILAAGVTRQAYVTFINRAITNSYYNCVACAGQTVYDAYVSLIVIEAAIVFGSDAGVHLRRSLVEEVSTLGRLNGDCPLVGAVASPGAPFQGVPVFNNNLESLFSVLRVAYSERNRKAEGIRNGHRRAADLLYTKPGVRRQRTA
ncbi:hypothetical protein FOZ62_013304 [Perkinsus olseni]|uniref:MULE transposase domain-containing protein n=1 Tax=Perkinsus olseni TaxID=32597 RepID=A0A7J6T7C2_PEROL|nr:hypothetical protein FOZ62_013304 [Perkinsus olseni]